jgi:hypothetical protein
MQVPSLPAVPLSKLEIAELRKYRNSLKEEEAKASYWRRLIQHRLNLIACERSEGHLPIEDLIRALGETGSGHRRRQLLTVEAEEELPQLPGLDELWTQDPDLNDREALETLVAELQKVEEQISTYRQGVLSRLNAATAEIVSRYKVNPGLALDYFPVNVR